MIVKSSTQDFINVVLKDFRINMIYAQDSSDFKIQFTYKDQVLLQRIILAKTIESKESNAIRNVFGSIEGKQ